MLSMLVSGSYFPPQTGGISTMMAEVCKQLGEHQVAVLTGVKGPVDDPRIGRVRVHRMNTHQRPRSLPATLRLIGTVGAALVRERPAVLQYATLEDAHLAYWTHRALRIPHVMYAHGNEILAAARSSWTKPRAALSASACVVANSRYTETLLRNLGLRDHQVRVVHPGCDLERFRPQHVTPEMRARLFGDRTPQRHVLLTVGNLVERKGHDTVIRALPLLATQGHDIVYLIVGEGPHRAALEKLAASIGVIDRVVFLGRVSTADLPLLYSAADVFIMASRERREHCDVEGFGIVFIEAAACGTPSIGGRSGGVSDAVVDRVTGLLVDPLDSADVARAIGSLLANQDFARQLGDNARRRAVSQFSWSRFGEAVSTILDEVVRGHVHSVAP